MKGILWIVIAVLIGWGVWYLFTSLESPSETPATTKEEDAGPVVIGAIIPLTGDRAAYGLPIQKAGQLAIDELNAAGGIAGKQLRVIWEDGKCDAKDAAAAAQKLINVDRVKYILGGVCSSEVLAGAPLAESNQVVWISPSATSPDITNAGDYIFRTAPSDALAGKIAAQYAYTTLGGRTAAVLSESKDYAQGLRRAFKESFEELGGAIVIDEAFNTEDTDFRTRALKIKSEKPNIIYIIPQTPTPGILILQQLRDQKVTGALLTAEVLMSRDIVKDNAAALKDVVGIEPYFDAKRPITKSFTDGFATRYGEELALPSFMANYYSQFYLLKNAIETVGDDATKVKNWLYEVEWEHALGKLNFDEHGDPLAQYQILKVADGAVAPLEVVQPQ